MQSLLDSESSQSSDESEPKSGFVIYISLIVGFVVFGIMTLFGVHIYNSFVGAMNGTVMLETSEQHAAVAGFDRGMATFDTVSVIIVILMIISVGIGSYYLSSSPIFFVLMLIFGVVLGAVSWFLNYFSAAFIFNPVFSTTMQSFPKLAILMTNLHWIALLMIIVGILVRFGKKEVGDGNNAYL